MAEISTGVSDELESQNIEEPVINSETEERRLMSHRFFEIMKENDIYAVRAFCGIESDGITQDGPKPRAFDLANADPKVEEELEDGLVEFYKNDKNSGFFIFEGAHPEHQTVLFKLKLNEVDPRLAFHNELHFYQDLAPLLQEYLADKKIKIPQLLSGGFSKEGYSYIVTTFAEGRIMGEINDAENPLPMDEFQELIEFIYFLQKELSLEKIKEVSPNFVLRNSRWDKYSNLRTEYQEEWPEIFGPDYVEKMQQLLTENEQLLENSSGVFTNNDIQPSNIIKSNEGVTIIDWERLSNVQNVAVAYNHMIESHWRFPQLQQEMIGRVLELNKSDPDFKKFFQIDMIFAQYSRGYRERLKKLDDPGLSEEEKTGIKEDLIVVVKFIEDAINGEGAWK